MKRIRLLTAVGRTAFRSNNFNAWDKIKALALFGILFTFSSLTNAQLTVTASGLPNVGRGQIKFADFNNDGKLDALVIGQTAAYATSGCMMGFYTGNGDGTFTDATATWLTPATPTAVNEGMAGVADYDKDGYLDFCYAGRSAAGANVVYLYHNNAGTTFTNNTTAAFAGTTAPTGCYFGSIEWGDVDNDGDLDLLIHGRTYSSLAYPSSSGYRGTITQLYKNNNNGTFTSSAIPTNGACYGQTLFADLDQDGDLDYVFYGGGNIGGHGINDGTGTFTVTNYSGTGNLARASNMVYGDFNKDGKIDYIQSFINSATVPAPVTKLCINTTSTPGTWAYSNSNPASIPPLGSNGTYTNSGIVAAADYDGDGDLDLSIHGLATATPTTILYLNNGETTTPTFTSAGLTLTGLQYGGEVWADLNNDNKPDLITFGYSDNVASVPATIVYLNGSTSNTAPQAPSTITATPSGSVATLSWTMPSSADDHTPNASLTYNIRIGTSTGASNTMTASVYGPGKYNLTTATVKGLADGNYFWSVQAVDAAFVPGTWATEGTFMIGSPTSIPTVQAINVAASATTQTTLSVGWTNGDGYKTAVFMKEGTSVVDYPAPAANTAYTPNTAFGSGSQIGTSGWYCVYNGPVTPLGSNSVVGTGLTGKRDFQFMAVSYNGSADNSIVNYLTTSSTNNPVIISTLDYVAPTTVISGVAATTITSTTVSITPSENSTSNYACVVFIKLGSNASDDVPLVSNTTYASNLAYGNAGTQVGTSGWYCVYNGNTSYKSNSNFNPFSTFTGLSPNLSYQVRACTYNGVAGLEKFSATAGTVFTTTASTSSIFQTEGNWSTYSNWSAGIPGAATTTVTIASNCTKDDDLTISPATRYTLNDGVTLTVNGNLNINSSTIEPGTFVDHNSTGGLTVTGTSTVQQYLAGAGDATPNGRFWYISSPVTGAVSGAVSASGNNKLWSYSEETTSYTEITDDVTTLSVGKGYVARLGASANASFAGVLNTGDKSFNITRTGETNSYRGFNLIGNPYASYVTFSAADNASIEPTTWFRTQLSTLAGMAFDTYNIETGDYVSGSGNGAVTGFIPPMQAFWVKTHTVGTTSVVFKQANRSHQTGAKLRSAEADTTPRIRLQITNGKCKDQTLIGLYTNATDAFDRFDSHKMTNNVDSFPEIFTMNGNEELAINGLKHDGRTKTLALGFRTGKKGDFKLKVLEMKNLGDSVRVILKDKIKNCEKQLTDTAEYDFTSDVATTTDRFTIVITANAPTSLKDVTTASADAFSNSDNQIQVRLIGTSDNNAKVKVYSTLGQQVGVFTTNSANTVLSKRFAPGVYMVNVAAQGVQVTKKVVINQ
jgi:hypothetical protein